MMLRTATGAVLALFLAPGLLAQDNPAEQARRLLEDSGPRGFLAVSAPYPVDLAFRGRTLVQGQSQFRVSLPAGRQAVTLTSARVFLRHNASIDVPADGTVTLSAPGTGKLHIRASPDNCEIFVNGAFVDYPPILDRPAAAGRHVIGFRWPDGSKREETVEVKAGSPAFVVGRKE